MPKTWASIFLLILGSANLRGGGELDNENGATWEVEVTTSDGSTVDVYLDDNYDLITIEGDSEVEDSENENEE
jgi:hypothetical protein